MALPLPAAKICDFTAELRADDDRLHNLTDDEFKNRMQLQEMQQQYEGVLKSLREEYEEALKEGINLPSYAS